VAQRRVRPEAPDDFGAVRLVHDEAFAPSTVEAEPVDALRAAGDHVPKLCLVPLDDGEVVGHIAFSRARLESGGEVLALAPMGGMPEHQRMGAALMEEALRRLPAYSEGARGLVLDPGAFGEGELTPGTGIAGKGLTTQKR
jgi:putative acetyltransferase